MRLIFIKKINEKNLIKWINNIYLKIVIVVKKIKKWTSTALSAMILIMTKIKSLEFFCVDTHFAKFV
jgi:hypothetical protein